MTRNGHALGGARFEAGQRHQVKRNSIPCPDCGAGVGEYCVTATGRRLVTGHASRVRLATRAANESGLRTPSNTAVTIYTTSSGRHLLVGDHTACGRKVGRVNAIRKGALSAGVERNISCRACWDALSEAVSA